MSLEYRFIKPVDTLYLRGNQLFGEPGSYGASMIPPWPSVAAGAIRSRMLVDDNINLASFKSGADVHPSLGTPESPGSFTLAAFHLAKQFDNQVELLVEPPADLVIGEKDNPQSYDKTKNEHLLVQRLLPQTIALKNSATLPQLPVLAQTQRNKPLSGYWLTQAGWQHYLAGQTPTHQHLVHANELWKTDNRVGIGMDSVTGSVEKGKLFTTQAIILQNQVGFIVAVNGAIPPTNGLLRFGGDARGASIHTIDFNPAEPDYDAIAKAGRCRMILTTPGLFQHGWKPDIVDDDLKLQAHGIHADLVCASVPRYSVISGWDLANHAPKPALRAASTGSVYWLENLNANPDQLRKLVNTGLWPENPDNIPHQRQRQAEGFNRFSLAAW